jgi:hypothetical protein
MFCGNTQTNYRIESTGQHLFRFSGIRNKIRESERTPDGERVFINHLTFLKLQRVRQKHCEKIYKFHSFNHGRASE